MKGIELNEEFKKALDLLENTSRNIFITGRAGTGKSTLLEYFRNTTRKKTVFLAPTGVSAVNIRGETIHSFFGFKPNITLDKIKKIKFRKKSEIYRKIETIVIDEISMVRADLLDCMDKFLRLNRENLTQPFGGVQMVFIGDLYQLPPVILNKEREVFSSYYRSGYFFDARVFKNIEMEFIELEKIYRQKDQEFIRILNAIRNNTVRDEDLNILNKRVKPDLKIEELNYYIYLTTTNKLASRINQMQLKKIKSRVYTFDGKIRGEFDKSYLPAEYELKIKIGAQVMLLNNDEYGRWINGTIAKVVDIREDKLNRKVIYVELPAGNIEEVKPYKWEIFHFQLNPQTQLLEAKSMGEFVQYPLKLAWAITIHKSQGKTFERVVIDISGGIFAYGQVYVALSRCRSLEGIILTRPIKKKHIFMDKKIVDFLTRYQYKISERDLPLSEKIKIIKRAIENDQSIQITYLKTNDEKSKRIIKPLKVGRMNYAGKEFTGIEAYCFRRNEMRIFRVDRILKIEDAKLREEIKV